MPIFETDDHNMYFLAMVPIHRAFVNEKDYLDSIGKELDEGYTKDFIIDFIKESRIELTERQLEILKLISDDGSITSQKISQRISQKNGVTSRTIIKEMNYLQKIGILRREGGRKKGRWVIITEQK